MTGDLNLLMNVSHITPIPVVLPNGVITFARKRGMGLGKKLVLNDVLFVPDLQCNLISIAQLIEDLCCVVTFNRKLCMIQDPTTKMLIGSGEHRKGIYFYKGDTTAEVQANKVVAYGLWHRRMGHPSNQALLNLSSIDSGISNNHKEDLCDVCLRAKQTHLPFNISRNKAQKPFDLVHCDIWGAYFVKSFCGAS